MSIRYDVKAVALHESQFFLVSKYTGLFEMIVRILTTCHTQYT